ncbi:MAG: acyl-CoA dehydrogenase N-terminal domain-containing protein, partial [Microthrixaceae bacterium]|nr:acyl-CoA dehydrogenase N-terminal domain-containing protein [Microthrixaceae bacterium]
MSAYRAPVKDALFTLRHIGELDRLAATERYGAADAATVADVLGEHGRFMQEVFAPLNRSGDVEGLRL